MSMTTNDVANIIYASPGLVDQVKFDIKNSRKNILILCGLIQKGMGGKDESGTNILLQDMPKDVQEEIHKIIQEILQKAGLSEFHLALNALGKK